jgi:hypothetical protein
VLLAAAHVELLTTREGQSQAIVHYGVPMFLDSTPPGNSHNALARGQPPWKTDLREQRHIGTCKTLATCRAPLRLREGWRAWSPFCETSWQCMHRGKVLRRFTAGWIPLNALLHRSNRKQARAAAAQHLCNRISSVPGAYGIQNTPVPWQPQCSTSVPRFPPLGHPPTPG